MLGGGGHAAVLAETLLANGRHILAVVSPSPVREIGPLSGVDLLVSDNDLLMAYGPKEVELINGIGSIPGNSIRAEIFDFYSEKGYSFASVISEKAILSDYLVLGEGVQVMAGVIMQAHAVIGKNSIINTGAIVEHDSIIGEHNHVAPGVTLSGGVITESNVHIGTGASIIQNVRIGEDSVVGAGTTVSKNMPKSQVLVSARNRILSKEK